MGGTWEPLSNHEVVIPRKKCWFVAEIPTIQIFMTEITGNFPRKKFQLGKLLNTKFIVKNMSKLNISKTKLKQSQLKILNMNHFWVNFLLGTYH